MAELKETNTAKIRGALDNIVTLTGVKGLPDKEMIYVAEQLKKGSYKNLGFNELAEAFKLYSNQQLDYTDEPFQLSLKFLGAVLRSYQNYKGKQRAPQRQLIKKTYNQKVDSSAEGHYKALCNIANNYKEVPYIGMWGKVYSYLTGQDVIKKITKDEKSRAKARLLLMGIERPLEKDIEREAKRIAVIKHLTDKYGTLKELKI